MDDDRFSVRGRRLYTWVHDCIRARISQTSYISALIVAVDVKSPGKPIESSLFSSYLEHPLSLNFSYSVQAMGRHDGVPFSIFHCLQALLLLPLLLNDL
jgi:hypothetical protein